MWALLPIKDLAGAKQRLSGVLAPHERLALFRAMAEDVIAALAGVRGLAGVAVVSADPWAAELAARHGARLIPERANRGQSAAVADGAAALAAAGVGAILAVPADVPLATPAALGRVVRAHGAAPAVTIVPARDGRGTNCLVCSPPDAIAFRFGTDSFARHLEEARRAGIAPRALRLPGLGLDIDTPGDLEALLLRPAANRTRAYLDDSGIARRLGTAARPPSADLAGRQAEIGA